MDPELRHEAEKGAPAAAHALKKELRMAHMELRLKEREIELAARERAAGSVTKKQAVDSMLMMHDLAVTFSSGSISSPD